MCSCMMKHMGYLLRVVLTDAYTALFVRTILQLFSNSWTSSPFPCRLISGACYPVCPVAEGLAAALEVLDEMETLRAKR